MTTENCLGMKVEVGSSVIYFEYRTAEQGTAEFRRYYFDIRYFLFDLPAMPLGRLEITLNVLSVPQLLFDPSAFCMAGGYSAVQKNKKCKLLMGLYERHLFFFAICSPDT